MSSLSETSLSVLVSNPPTSTTTIVIFTVLVLTMASFIIHFASPMRLTHVLVAAISNVEKSYLEAIEAGALSKTDVHIAEMLSSLQIKVSNIRETTLRDSLSPRRGLREFFKGRTFAVLNCMRELRELEVHIEKDTSAPLTLLGPRYGRLPSDEEISTPLPGPSSEIPPLVTACNVVASGYVEFPKFCSSYNPVPPLSYCSPINLHPLSFFSTFTTCSVLV
ncbi:hypothetical protein C8R44DRAFT_879307 [Mycena epipterygia]|nr:hypothetical protein C8R44DRAFT_879307 [Mycena epipterygia]